MTNLNCPIPTTHRRLSHAHRTWHQALKDYGDPEGFQANLNATIEALRNVTFVLQSEKGGVPKFQEWYEAWRVRMKADPVMRWLHDARTTVVHQADLEIASTAIAQIHNNFVVATSKMEVPALMPTAAVARSLAEHLPEPLASSRRDLVMSIERRWSVESLPNYEILDALAYVYGVLSTIVAEAHERAGADFETQDHQGRIVVGPGGRLPCMITTLESRTTRFALEDGRLLAPLHIEVPFDPATIPELEQRYGPAPEALENSSDPFGFAEALVPIAKRALENDRYHIRLFYLRTPHGWTMRVIEAADRSEKYSLLRLLANESKASQVDAVVEISEVWLTRLSEERSAKGKEEPERLEALIVSAAIADGRYRSYDTVFSRDPSGAISFDETIVRDGPLPPYMMPFCEIWGLPLPSLAPLSGDRTSG